MSSDMKWKLVPVDPTEEMLSAGHDAWGGDDALDFPITWNVYRAMIDAAPTGEVAVPVYVSSGALKELRNSGSVVAFLRAERLNQHDDVLYTTPPTVSTDAVRRAALEEAAQEAYRVVRYWASVSFARDTEAAIRALATQPAPDGRG